MFAFRAKEIDIFTHLDKEEHFLVSRLVCADCSAFWETSLQECFLCKEIRYYTLFCRECKNHNKTTYFTTLTTTATKCPTCNAKNSFFPDCVNPNCVSNTDEKLKKIIAGTISKGNTGKHKPGVFGEHSGWNTTNSYCLKCGSERSNYKTHTLSIFESSKSNFDKNDFEKFYDKTDVVMLVDAEQRNYDIFVKDTDDFQTFKPKFDYSIDGIIEKIFS